MGRNYQIWLNFKSFQAKKFTIRAAIRFIEPSKLSYFKVSLLSDDGPEYNVQLKRETSSDWIIVIKAANMVETLVSDYQIEDSLNREWTNLETVLDHSRAVFAFARAMVFASWDSRNRFGGSHTRCFDSGRSPHSWVRTSACRCFSRLVENDSRKSSEAIFSRQCGATLSDQIG